MYVVDLYCMLVSDPFNSPNVEGKPILLLPDVMNQGFCNCPERINEKAAN